VQKTINLNVRMDKELHSFIRQIAFDKNVSMNYIVLKCLKKFKEKEEKKVDRNS
jgi:predicted HicB family RNase H-like nuclease